MNHILKPAVRRWAYGVAAAAVPVAVLVGLIDIKAAPVILPLLMALFYVNDSGEPREDSPAL